MTHQRKSAAKCDAKHGEIFSFLNKFHANLSCYLHFNYLECWRKEINSQKYVFVGFHVSERKVLAKIWKWILKVRSLRLESKNWTRYFQENSATKRYFSKSNSIFWKLVKFSIILYIYIFVGIDFMREKLSKMRTPPQPDSQRLNFFNVFPNSFLKFLSLWKCLFEKVETYSDRTWNSLSPCLIHFSFAFINWKIIRAHWK